MQPSKTGYVELRGVRTWYAEYGDASADPLVLLHPGGGGTDSRAFGPTLEGFAARFRVFTPERHGELITIFLTSDPVPTVAPIRRK